MLDSSLFIFTNTLNLMRLAAIVALGILVKSHLGYSLLKYLSFNNKSVRILTVFSVSIKVH